MVLKPSGNPGITPGERFCVTMYTAQQPRDRFNMRFSKQERAQITYIMERENIPDVSKTIRYCVSEKAAQLQAAETLQQKKGE